MGKKEKEERGQKDIRDKKEPLEKIRTLFLDSTGLLNCNVRTNANLTANSDCIKH